MSTIAFIGLGNMGSGMAANQAKAGNRVLAFDLSEDAIARAVDNGCEAAGSVAEAVGQADIVLSMPPAGRHVRGLYENDVLPHVKQGALLIDCSTIDVDSARAVNAMAKEAGFGPLMRRSPAAPLPTPERWPLWWGVRRLISPIFRPHWSRCQKPRCMPVRPVPVRRQDLQQYVAGHHHGRDV